MLLLLLLVVVVVEGVEMGVLVAGVIFVAGVATRC